jgi:molybdenum cofactor cytidylyltransferase
VTEAVAGVILAAGASRRMEGDTVKQLLPWGDTTMVGAVVAAAEASRLDRIVVVVGHRAAEVEASLPGGRRIVATNPDYRAGNLSSFRVGLAAARNPAAVLVLLGDMPSVGPGIIDRMLDVWEASRPWAAVAEYRHATRHPLLLSAEAVAGIDPAAGGKALWRLIEEAAPGAVRRVQFNLSPPQDVNTLADYRAALGRAGGRARRHGPA